MILPFLRKSITLTVLMSYITQMMMPVAQAMDSPQPSIGMDALKGRKLSLRCKELYSLPQKLLHRTYLVKLDLSYNDLENIQGIENLTNLTELDLTDNNLKNIQGIEKLIKLTTLDLHYTGIENIQGIENLTNLTKLDLPQVKLQNIHKIKNLTNLTTLNLYGNRLDNVQGIRNLTNLITLNLSSNNLTNLSNLEGIENLTNLKHLDFSYNTLLVQSLGKGGCYGLLKEDDAIKQLQAELLKYFNILKYFLLKNTNIPNIDISKDVVNYIFTMYVSTEKYQINFHNGYYKKKY